MKRTTLVTLFFAALLGVSAQAQIITNYGQGTYAAGAGDNGPISYGTWDGSWDGQTGRTINNTGSVGRWAAQTFIAPTSGSSTLYAYNFQLNSTVNASFTTSIYEWTGTTTGTLVAGTTTSFTASGTFNPYGMNLVTNPGFGVTLTPGATYALVLNRTDLGVSGTVQFGYDTTGADTPGSGEYTGGGAFKSTTGVGAYTALGGNDMAFWISFDAASLSPVPEPAVNGAIIGGLFVAGLLTWRRYGRKAAA
ncbi:MAG: hypothetical protein WC661_20240 [Opitutaceae bacterium]|jgi:hypothetical protein